MMAAAAWPLAGRGADLPEPVALRPRVRPGDPDWPDPSRWAELGRAVGGRLLPVESPLLACRGGGPATCDSLFQSLNNPWLLGETVGLTQSLGWVDAWASMPSAYAVAATGTADVVAAVNFARRHRLRLVVKGGGHSYQGTSNAPDSLLVWTRAMSDIELHDRFVPTDCAVAPMAAVSVGAGALWGPVYDAVSTGGGRYVQGGGCLTVGVAGLVQSGGFGSFSKRHGLAAASLLEAEVVTADGLVRIVNACRHPDLFWGLKGGGGGSLGIVTRLTLRTHELPATFSAVNMEIAASSDEAHRRLIGLAIGHCRERLINPVWGEQIVLRRRELRINMLAHGIGRGEASDVWQAFIDAVGASPRDFQFKQAPLIIGLSARRFWDPTHWRPPGVTATDPRPGAPASHMVWAGDQGQAGQVIHAYESAWLPASLLRPERADALADALFGASRHWPVALHLNKGLAGAPPSALQASRDTATHPAVLDAFALAICGAEEPAAYPGIAGHEPDVGRARSRAKAVASAMAELRRVAGDSGAYLAESNYFEPRWQEAFWGANHPRLAAVKARYDPSGLFFVHHGIGSEQWEDDGFTPRA